MGRSRINRREFLGLAGLGAAAGLGASGIISSSGALGAQAGAPPWPWPYRKLDPEDVRKRGHLAFYEAG